MKKKFFRGKNYRIPKDDKVKVAGYTKGRTKITHNTKSNMSKGNNLINYSRQPGNAYTDPKTGKTIAYKTTMKKTDKNLKRSLNNTVRPLLENNFFGGNNEVFVTLTYAKTMSDLLQLTVDYDKFWRKLCNIYSHLELACIYVKEIQKDRYSWHIHSIIKEVNGKYLHIPFDELTKLWGLGNVWINRVSPRFDNSNYEISIDKEMQHLKFGNVHSYNKVIDYMCKTKSKKGVFPSGAKIHGNKGKLKGPVISVMTYEEANKNILKDYKCVNSDTTLVFDDYTSEFLNCVKHEYWIKPTQNKENKDNNEDN